MDVFGSFGRCCRELLLLTRANHQFLRLNSILSTIAEPNKIIVSFLSDNNELQNLLENTPAECRVHVSLMDVFFKTSKLNYSHCLSFVKSMSSLEAASTEEDELEHFSHLIKLNSEIVTDLKALLICVFRY